MFKGALSLLRLIPAAPRVSAECKSKCVDLVVPMRSLHLTTEKYASERRDLRTYRMSMPAKDEGAVGERAVDIDGIGQQWVFCNSLIFHDRHLKYILISFCRDDLFPDVNTPNRLFDGIPFKELPIFNVKVTKNNTIISLTDFKGKLHEISSQKIIF